MIPEVHGRKLVSSGDQESAAFGISGADTAHIMTLLRQTIYADKVRAVLREYGANAKDAMADAGKADQPIEVRLPTLADPTLEIRDHGPGLTHEQVFRVFTQYGASTKRGSNLTIGYLGIGSKSGFAYGDSFTIISRCEGRRRTYVAVLDDSECGLIKLLDDSEEETGDTGLTIQLGVKRYDINEFIQKAREVFRFFSPRPIINVDLPEEITESTLMNGQSKWLAVMGGIAYPIDLSQLTVPDYIEHSGGVVFFGIGELRVAASREALNYDDFTKKNLVERLTATLDAYIQRFSRQLATYSDWEKRLQLQGMSLFESLLTKVLFQGAFKDSIDLKKRGDIQHLRVNFNSIVVDRSTRLVFVDDTKALKGYGLGKKDCVVRRAAGSTVAEAWANLQTVIATLKIEGIPVVKTSTMTWTRPLKGAGSAGSVKHRMRAFVFQPNDDTWFHKPMSRYWEPVDRTPEDEDVYAVLDAFDTDMYSQWRADLPILDTFRIRPTIYGYKAPKNGGKLVGIPYSEWRQSLYDKVVEVYPEIDAVMAALPYENFQRFSLKDLGRAAVELGPNHSISKVLANVIAAVTLLASTPSDKIAAARTLSNRLDRDPDEVTDDIDAITKDYPLVSRLESILYGDAAPWFEYIKALDYMRAAQKELADAA